MNIVVLGKYGRFAPSGEATNGYLIEYNGKKILLDFGAGCLSKLLEKGAADDIDAVILTHLHFDHISDIFITDYMRCYRKRRTKNAKISVYLPKSPSNVRELIGECKSYEPVSIEEGTINICGLDVEFIPSVHTVETYSIAFCTDTHRIVYTSDISDSARLRRTVSGADIVIGDACVLERQYTASSPHVSVAALANAVDMSTQLYLGHLSAGEEREILAEAVKYHPGAMIMKDLTNI